MATAVDPTDVASRGEKSGGCGGRGAPSRRRLPSVTCTGLGKRVGPRMREFIPHDQRVSGGEIQWPQGCQIGLSRGGGMGKERNKILQSGATVLQAQRAKHIYNLKIWL